MNVQLTQMNVQLTQMNVQLTLVTVHLQLLRDEKTKKKQNICLLMQPTYNNYCSLSGTAIINQ